MNKKELKSLIKEMVRESLTEIFVEMKLENIVEKVVQQHQPVLSERVSSIPKASFVTEDRPQRSSQRESIRENLRSKLAVSDDEWRNIYETVDMEKLPPSGASTVMENPEFTTEDDLRKLGLL